MDDDVFNHPPFYSIMRHDLMPVLFGTNQSSGTETGIRDAPYVTLKCIDNSFRFSVILDGSTIFKTISSTD